MKKVSYILVLLTFIYFSNCKSKELDRNEARQIIELACQLPHREARIFRIGSFKEFNGGSTECDITKLYAGEVFLMNQGYRVLSSYAKDQGFMGYQDCIYTLQ